jgi:putative flippase GtrA
MWHQQWTWGDRSAGAETTRVLARLARFNVSTGLISIVGNLLVMRALVGGFGFNVILANLIAIATCAVINFLVNDRWVFSPT